MRRLQIFTRLTQRSINLIRTIGEERGIRMPSGKVNESEVIRSLLKDADPRFVETEGE